MSVEGLVGVECGGEGAEVWPAGVAIEGWSTVVEPTQCNPQLVQWIPYEDSPASAPPPRAPQPACLWPATAAGQQYPLMTINNNQQPVWTHITRDAPQQNYWAQQAFESNHNQCSPVYTSLHQPPPPASLPHPQYNAPATNQRFSNEQFKLKPNYQTLVQHPAATAPATNQQQPLYHITINRQPPPSTKPVKKVTKRKRVRTAFTTDQILALEEVYSTQTYVNRNERQVLTDRLKISDRAIKVWFQNRRMKGKRESQASLEYSDEFEGTPEQPEPIQEPSSSIDSVTSNSSSELDYVESQIKRSDEHGYVTLDDKAWGTLFNVIDPYVPNYVGLSPDTTTKEIVTEDLKTEFYEPISPADSNGSAAEDMES
ncbi:brain-specific homeobox protein homolog [Plutella xylostella]|uniref:brain-specific homeobox protein homolog n=1 Tax=Plutella xylostella TaxID=51655 RepID=UPI00203274B5|nr:brain-specific homeobox protein homolog [Plutella xylostella]